MTDLLFSPGLSGLLEVAGRATVVLGMALAFAWLIRKGLATARHHLWTLTFLLLLALPVLTLLGPSWELPLIPSPGRAQAVPVAEVPFDPDQVDPARPTGRAGGPAHAALVVAHTASRIYDLPLLIWAIGCVAALASLGLGILRFWKLVRSGRPVDDPSWHRQLKTVQQQLGCRADVRLLVGGEVVTPMTGGLWSPVILLPASASAWSTARRTVVLTHELVHVRRRDALRQLLGRVVLALYWFHPLSWVASRMAAASREEACDEAVLAVGARPSEYAKHLLALAANLSRTPAALSLPMVHLSQLERRIMSITRNRAGRQGPATAVVLTALAVAAVSASVANPVPGRTAPTIAGQPVSAESAPRDCSFVSAETYVAKRSIDDAVLCIGFNGDVAMSQDLLEVLAIFEGGSVVLESSGSRVHRLVITQGPDGPQGPSGLEYDWSIDGRTQAFDDEARQWRDLMLASLRGLLWDVHIAPGQRGGFRASAGSKWSETAEIWNQAASLRREVARLLAEMATNRAEELSLRSAVMAASNTGTRDALEEEITSRVERIRELKKSVEGFELSPLESEIQQEIEQYDAELSARGLERVLSDLVVDHLRTEARSGQSEIDALRHLING